MAAEMNVFCLGFFFVISLEVWQYFRRAWWEELWENYFVKLFQFLHSQSGFSCYSRIV